MPRRSTGKVLLGGVMARVHANSADQASRQASAPYTPLPANKSALVKLPKVDLQAHCEAMGLEKSGDKDALVSRLMDSMIVEASALASKPAAAPAEPELVPSTRSRRPRRTSSAVLAASTPADAAPAPTALEGNGSSHRARRNSRRTDMVAAEPAPAQPVVGKAATDAKPRRSRRTRSAGEDAAAEPAAPEPAAATAEPTPRRSRSRAVSAAGDPPEAPAVEGEVLARRGRRSSVASAADAGAAAPRQRSSSRSTTIRAADGEAAVYSSVQLSRKDKKWLQQAVADCGLDPSLFATKAQLCDALLARTVGDAQPALGGAQQVQEAAAISAAQREALAKGFWEAPCEAPLSDEAHDEALAAFDHLEPFQAIVAAPGVDRYDALAAAVAEAEAMDLEAAVVQATMDILRKQQEQEQADAERLRQQQQAAEAEAADRQLTLVQAQAHTASGAGSTAMAADALVSSPGAVVHSAMAGARRGATSSIASAPPRLLERPQRRVSTSSVSAVADAPTVHSGGSAYMGADEAAVAAGLASTWPRVAGSSDAGSTAAARAAAALQAALRDELPGSADVAIVERSYEAGSQVAEPMQQPFMSYEQTLDEMVAGTPQMAWAEVPMGAEPQAAGGVAGMGLLHIEDSLDLAAEAALAGQAAPVVEAAPASSNGVHGWSAQAASAAERAVARELAADVLMTHTADDDEPQPAAARGVAARGLSRADRPAASTEAQLAPARHASQAAEPMIVLIAAVAAFAEKLKKAAEQWGAFWEAFPTGRKQH